MPVTLDLYEDTNSWEGVCEVCGRHWYLELVEYVELPDPAEILTGEPWHILLGH